MEEKIKAWLLNSGFPLEMRISNALLKRNFDVAQSVYYQDPESGKYRETDVIATKFKIINGTWIHLTFVIECKRSKDKPWVILKNDKLMNHLGDMLPLYSTTNTLSFLNSLNQQQYKSDLLFKKNRSIGYSIQTAFNNGSDRSYEAIQSVTKACEYFSQNINNRKNISAFYFPIILIEGIIFESQLLDDEIELKQVNDSEVLVTRSFHKYGNSHIKIFDDSNLNIVAEKLHNLTYNFFEKYDELIKANINPEIDPPYY